MRNKAPGYTDRSEKYKEKYDHHGVVRSTSTAEYGLILPRRSCWVLMKASDAAQDRALSPLGPLMFLLYINDIDENISSTVRLFVDDCVINFILTQTTLQKRRHIIRLSQFHKIVHHLTPSVQLPPYFQPTQYPTRQLHQHRYTIPVSSYQKSFFPNTLKELNSLTNNLIKEQSTETFISHLVIKQ